MFTRVVNFTGARNIDAGVRHIRETVAPLLRQQTGFRGATASADQSGGLLAILTIWDTEADREASEGTLLKAREEGLRIIGGHVAVERYEQAVAEMVTPPAVGSALLLQRLSMDPRKVDDNLAYFKSEVVPQLKAQSGFLAVRHMIDRASGEGMVGTTWTDATSLEAAAREADKRRQRAAERGVTFGERGRREIVFIDLP
jgi:heme-degrading monooxygenase HmoA